MRFLFVLIILSTSAWANLHLSPPNFPTKYGRAIFVDFLSAEYNITYTPTSKKVVVKTKIIFESKELGSPLFDLIPEPKNLILNNQSVEQKLISFPGDESKMRLIQYQLNPGRHTLTMESSFHRNTRYETRMRTVSSGFWIKDIAERKFWEQYVPSNLEYDQYKITMKVKIENSNKTHRLFANGHIWEEGFNQWKIEYPEYYTVSSPYFHLFPKGAKRFIQFKYRSISGRDIPITVYNYWPYSISKLKQKTIEYMDELEADYGPWGHPQFIAYQSGFGGMEYSGATITSLGALDHEMLHSYFAKGVMPYNGNTGWIDEGIARWRDDGYPRRPSLKDEVVNLAGHSPYRRNTDPDSYEKGAEFLSHLDYLMQDIGGLKAFLRGYFQAYNHTLVSTEHFKNNLEFFTGLELDALFDQHIYGRGDSSKRYHGKGKADPNHPHLSEEQLDSLL